MTDDPDDGFADRVSRLATLAEPVRRDLFRYVVEQAEPVSRDQASDGVGVARHTAKFHLDKLVEEGLLDTEFRRLSGRTGPGAGRPTKLYRRSAREVSVTVPDRHYDLAGRLMAGAIEQAAAAGADVVTELHRAAAEHGATLGRAAREAAGPRAGRTARLEAVRATLAEHGYQPRAGDDVVTLANCPFHALAQEHTDLVCGMNLALVSELAQQAAGTDLAVRLDPAPGRCCVTLAPS
jgi:predicted ArsR family transcriptional regulator